MQECFHCYFLDLSKHLQPLAYFFSLLLKAAIFNREICTRQHLPFLVQHRILTFPLVGFIFRALSYANDWFPVYTSRLFINFFTLVFSDSVDRFIHIYVGFSMIAAICWFRFDHQISFVRSIGSQKKKFPACSILILCRLPKFQQCNQYILSIYGSVSQQKLANSQKAFHRTQMYIQDKVTKTIPKVTCHCAIFYF